MISLNDFKASSRFVAPQTHDDVIHAHGTKLSSREQTESCQKIFPEKGEGKANSDAERCKQFVLFLSTPPKNFGLHTAIHSLLSRFVISK